MVAELPCEGKDFGRKIGIDQVVIDMVFPVSEVQMEVQRLSALRYLKQQPVPASLDLDV